MRATRKSPLTDKPLRYTGQSLDEEIEKYIDDKMLMYFFVAMSLVLATAMQWISYYRPINSPPIAGTTITLLISAFCAYKMYRNFKQLKALKLGRDGERAVGQYLELLREEGYRVFHDIVGPSFNIDHVIISQKGIFVIETKTYSKPVRVEPQPIIYYDGEKLLVDNHEPKSDILTQVKAASSWLKGVIKESTGKDFEIHPVIVFPGWFVENPGNLEGKTWVLNPKALSKYIANRKDLLAKDDVMLASYHISRYIRAGS